MKHEIFVATVQDEGRITIPEWLRKTKSLKKRDTIRLVYIEKVKQ